MPRKTYVLEHLGCAHCAAKMEERIARLDGVEDAVIVFATKQLRLNAENPDALLPEIQKIANSLEPDVTIHEYHRGSRTAAAPTPHEHHHHDGEECGCGCDHNHEHHHHGEECGCGCDHDHEHHHHHGEECGCGCDA
ncbi:MAG: cation transporter [Butyricicoccaceae bacterium]